MVDLVDQSEGQEADVPRSPAMRHKVANIEQIKWLKSILDPVYPLTIDQWQDALMRDASPRYKLAWWLGFAEIYRNATAGMPLERCKVVFEYLLQGDQWTTARKPGEYGDG